MQHRLSKAEPANQINNILSKPNQRQLKVNTQQAPHQYERREPASAQQNKRSHQILREYSEAKSISTSDFEGRGQQILKNDDELTVAIMSDFQSNSQLSTVHHNQNNQNFNGTLNNERQLYLEEYETEEGFQNPGSLLGPDYYMYLRPGAQSVLERGHDNSSPSSFITHNRKFNESKIKGGSPSNKHLPTKKVQVINILKKISKGAKSQKNQNNGVSQQIDLESKDLIDYQQTMDPRSQGSHHYSHHHHNTPQNAYNKPKILKKDESSQSEMNFDIPEGFATVKPHKMILQKSNLPLYSQNSMTPSHQHSLSQHAMNSMSEGYQSLTLNLVPTSGGSPPVMNRRAKAQGLNSTVSQQNQQLLLQQQHHQPQQQQHQLQNYDSSSNSSLKINTASYSQSKIVTFNNSQYSNKNQNNHSMFNQSHYYKLSGAASSANNQKSSNEDGLSEYQNQQQTPIALHSKKLSLQINRANDQSSKFNNESSSFKKPPMQLQQMPNNNSSTYLYRDQSASRGKMIPQNDIIISSKLPTLDVRQNFNQNKFQAINGVSTQGNQKFRQIEQSPSQSLINGQPQSFNGSLIEQSNYQPAGIQAAGKNKGHQRDASADNEALDFNLLNSTLKNQLSKDMSFQNCGNNNSIVILPKALNQAQTYSRQQTKTQLAHQTQNQAKQFTSINSQFRNENAKNLQNQSGNRTVIQNYGTKPHNLQDRDNNQSPNITSIKHNVQFHKRSETATEIFGQGFIGNRTYQHQQLQGLNQVGSQQSLMGSVISTGDEQLNNLSTPVYAKQKILKLQNQQQVAAANLTSVKKQNLNNLSNFGPEESKSVKKIIKKIALLNNASSNIQLTLQQVNSTPQHKIESKNKIYLQNQDSSINKVKEVTSMTTKHSANQVFAFNQIAGDGKQKQLNHQSDKISQQHNISNSGSPKSFMIAKDSIQPADLSMDRGESRLAYMTLKKNPNKPSNHSSSSNLGISGSHTLTINNKNGSNTSLLQNLPQDFFQAVLSQPTSQELPQVTPEAITKGQKAMAVITKLTKKVQMNDGRDNNPHYQRNLKNNHYFREGSNDPLPSENSIGETPSFNTTQMNQQALNFASQQVEKEHAYYSHKNDKRNLKNKLEQTILPTINRQRTLDNQILNFLPHNTSTVDSMKKQQVYQTFTTQNTLQNSQLEHMSSIPSSGNLHSDVNQTTQSNSRYHQVNSNVPQQQKKYVKMIQKFVNKGPAHQRNFTTQIEPQSRAATYNLQASEAQKLSQKFKVKLVSTNETPGQGHKLDPLQVAPQKSEDEQSRQDSHSHIKLPPSVKQSMNTNGETNEESPLMNELRKIQQQFKSKENSRGQIDAEEAYSPTHEASYSRKKSVIQSFQTQVIGVKITPAYDKATVANQLQSVLQINHFQQSLDNKSTEDSSKQEFISRYNSGQIPIIHSVASSQIKSHSTNGMPGGQNFSSLSANNYQQLLQKMISIRDSQPGRSPSQGELTLKPTSSLGGGSKNPKLQASSSGKKATSLIKEDSNEEKSSSNSNSNQEIIVDPQVQQIKKDDLFTKKLKVLLSSRHKRQKTAQLNFIYGRQQSSFIEKRYHEDKIDANDNSSLNQIENTGYHNHQDAFKSTINQNDSICSVIVMTERSEEIAPISSRQMNQKKASELLASDATLGLKDLSTLNKNNLGAIDKNKHWLLDSSRFDYEEINRQHALEEQRRLEEMRAKNQQRISSDDVSDTVEFDNSSSNGTPDVIKNKDIEKKREVHVENLESSMDREQGNQTPKAIKSNKNLKVQESNQSPSMRLSRQIIISHLTTSAIKSANNSNFITIEQQAEESVIDGEAANETIAKELNISAEIEIILPTEQLAQKIKLEDIQVDEAMKEFHKKLNVEVTERVILYPKYKLPSLDNFLQPSYYDTIYLAQVGQNTEDLPKLERLFNFD